MMSTLQFKTCRLIAVASMLALATWLTGCVTAQPVPTAESVVLADITPDQVRQSGATGSVVRWGGTITEINNLEDGTTAIQLVSRPLRSGGRPLHNDATEGRFIAETVDFLDPAIIKAGRDITLVGTVTAVREGKIGESVYQFPVVAVDNYRYWSNQNVAARRYHRHGYGYSPHRHDPFFHDWPFRPHGRHHRRSGVSGSIFFRL